ncbi:GNAT family N-acetyltransferase [Thalassobaculum sp.]|uniref:GNAT family N-acetyltransferase n=1 Tax=Thalassobaculum sp. TaxID=2022740 RepID=UPI0032EE324F
MTEAILVSTVADDADPAFADTKSQVLDWLDQHAVAASVVFDSKPFALTATRAGNTLGGLIGSTNLGWLHVQLLAVAPEARSQGVGRALLGAAESLARDRGCHAAWLDTYDHQGPDYYPRLGWAKFGELDDFPKGGVRRFYRKAL